MRITHTSKGRFVSLDTPLRDYRRSWKGRIEQNMLNKQERESAKRIVAMWFRDLLD